jgi:hypothetical protein
MLIFYGQIHLSFSYNGEKLLSVMLIINVNISLQYKYAISKIFRLHDQPMKPKMNKNLKIP